jgi:uncharacterized membrane protein
MQFNNLLKLYKTKEGKILFLGFFLILVLSLFIFISYFFNPEFSNKISGMIVTNIAVGRVPSLSFGYASQLSHFEVIVTNILVEMILVTILYPMFVFSYKDMLHIKFLEKFFDDVKNYQIKYKDKFDKYGVIGLFVFIFIPFWMTGPIVGSIIGYLLGMKHFNIMLIVFIATSISISIWGILLNELIVILNMINTSLVWFILVFIIVLFIFIKFLKKGN